MSIDHVYVSKLEEHVDNLEEENRKLKNLVNNGIVRIRDNPSKTKRKWLFFKEYSNQLSFGYAFNTYSCYSHNKKIKRTTPEELTSFCEEQFNKKGKSFEKIYPLIETRFNNIWYPTVDCDSEEDYHKVGLFFRDLGVSFTAFQSSLDHYWVIGDVGSKSFHNAMSVVSMLQYGDQKYKDMSRADQRFTIRAFNRDFKIRYLTTHTEGIVTENFDKFSTKLFTYYESSGFADYFGKYRDIGSEVRNV